MYMIDVLDWLSSKYKMVFQTYSISGERFQTYNCHSLLHLADDVKQRGPLWTHSCFPFEDCNGDLKDLFHGTQNIPGQVILLKMLYHVALRTQMVEQRINYEVCSVAWTAKWNPWKTH